MSLVCCVLLLVASAAPAFAERSIEVELVDPAPFDARELASAMRVRLPMDGVPVHVRVSTAGDGVRIEARGSTRDVQLGDLRGEAAARLVALAANDLLLDDLTVVAEPEPRARTNGPAVAVLGAAAAWNGTLTGLAVDVVVPRGNWLFAVDAGGSKLLDGPLVLSAAVVRASVGARSGMLELRAGATIAPLFVDDGAGDRTILFGAGASARIRVPIAAGLRAVVAGGVDVFATRTTYIVEGMPALATPRAALCFAAGLEVTP